MLEFRIESRDLKAATMEGVFERTVALAEEHAGRSRRRELRVLLNDLHFIDPYGLVCLWAVLRYLGDHFHRVRVHLPAGVEVQTYLQRMGFSATVAPCALEGSNCPERAWRSGSDVLLELTSIARHADVVKVTRDILNRIGTILQRQLGYTTRDVTAFSTVVAEVCTNIFDHSEDRGILAAQRYEQRNGTKFVIIGVADLGIGIRDSLAKRYRDAGKWTHVEAIVNALQKEYARNPQRGLGLHMVSKIVGEYRGSLLIRSGDAQLYFRHRAQVRGSASFPGTQLCISLSGREEKA